MTTHPLMTIGEALRETLPHILPVGVEEAQLAQAGGRVLAESITADRDSPACDVSAMDGFAVRAEQLRAGSLPIKGECRIGEAPEVLGERCAMKIFTGGPLPEGADTVLKVEDAQVENNALQLTPGATIEPGQHIRYRGENGKQGREVLASGSALTPAAITTAASVTPGPLRVHRRVRVTIITTGNELVQPESAESETPPPWRLRDSNGPALAALLGSAPWLEVAPLKHGSDDPAALAELLTATLGESDAVVFTGGISKGEHDYVPSVIESAGGDLRFHGLKIRPGKPMLGAVLDGAPVVGLPGNPLSVLATARVALAPMLRRRAGFALPNERHAQMILESPSEKPLGLEWFRPVRKVADGLARLEQVRGSGDVFGAGESDGLVAIPPGETGVGPFPFIHWSL